MDCLDKEKSNLSQRWSEVAKRKRKTTKRKKEKWSKKRKWTASGIGLVALTVLVLSQSLFAHAASYVNGTFILTPNLSGGGALTGSTSGTLSTEQAYTLSAGSATLWEYNLYPAFTTADVTTNKGYLMIEQSQLTNYSLPGGYGNPLFVKSELFDPRTHVWTLTTDTESSSTGGGSIPPSYTFDWYSFPDILNVNGMKNNTNFNTTVNNQAEAVYQPQTSLNVTNVLLPQFAPTISSVLGGSALTSLSQTNNYFLNLNPSQFGSNGGGSFSNDYMSAYWVPVESGGAYGTPTNALFNMASSSSGGGGAGLNAFPDPTTVAGLGGASPISLGYPDGMSSGIMYTEVADTSSGLSTQESQNPGTFLIALPSTIPSGTQSWDLVVYLADGVQRYDAQVIGNINISATQTQQTCTTPPSLSSTVSGNNATINVNDPNSDTLTIKTTGGTLKDLNGVNGTSTYAPFIRKIA